VADIILGEKREMNGKKFFASLVILVALASAGFAQSLSQSCPNQVTFGTHPRGPVDQSAEARFEVTYFTTDDPNVFISEHAGISRSASSAVRNTSEFIAKLRSLEGNGLASIQKQQSATSFMGESAELNLERDSINARGRMVNASMAAVSANSALDRETEISITHDMNVDGNYYRLNLLSWFVEATRAQGGQKIVDYDTSILMKPGQTLIIKLFSNFEQRRGSAGRKYMAVTLHSVTPVNIASTHTIAGQLR
jgi:hypothetical protein